MKTFRYMYKLFIALRFISLLTVTHAADLCNCIGYAGVGSPRYAGVGGQPYICVDGAYYKDVGGHRCNSSLVSKYSER